MRDRRSLPIGVFDSGIGGMTVVRKILRRLPHERLLYLGDTARLPYGSKSPETIRAYTRANLAFLRSRKVKAVVVACNSASAHGLPDSFDVPLLGVIEPGAEAAVTASRNGTIAVVGTRATIRSRAYERAIRRRKNNAQVTGIACPLLVPLAEEGMTRDPITISMVRRYLEPLLAKCHPDTLVLGCTHYPVLKAAFRQVAGSKVRIVDSASATAAALDRLLCDRWLSRRRGKGSLIVYLTDPNPHFRTIGRRFLGCPIRRIHQIDLGLGDYDPIEQKG